jgi:anaerobic ribonucleoside-triphosphate reductase activating protein
MYGTAQDSIVDGVGLRFAVFVQGCSHHCPGCHNPESQPTEGGYLQSVKSLLDEIHANRLARSVTLSGGEPFEQCEALLELARALKAEGYNLWIYSGYLYEDLMKGNPSPLAPELLAQCDVLVDGPFVQALHSYDLKWKGSSNQRVIDLNATRVEGEVRLFQQEELSFEKPPSW